MKGLADEVAIHQSTMTRVVEKLEAKDLVTRQRRPENQRQVEVALTEQGRSLYKQLDAESTALVGCVLALVDPKEQAGVVHGLEVLCELLDPRNAVVQALITGCGCTEVEP